MMNGAVPSSAAGDRLHSTSRPDAPTWRSALIAIGPKKGHISSQPTTSITRTPGSRPSALRIAGTSPPRLSPHEAPSPIASTKTDTRALRTRGGYHAQPLRGSAQRLRISRRASLPHDGTVRTAAGCMHMLDGPSAREARGPAEDEHELACHSVIIGNIDGAPNGALSSP